MGTDVLVVGSGAGAVHAAWPLVEAGLSVTMLDFGNEDRQYAPLVPARPWSELRRGDPDQHRYFLGERFEGIPFGRVRVGAQLTPPRMFIPADTEERTPVDSDTFATTESLARGGLASGWGAGVFPFDDGDLAPAPISAGDLAPHYEAVAERIGVSGARDDLLPFLGDCAVMLPPLELDTGAECVLERYGRARARMQAAGLHLGTTRLAACSQLHRGRGPHPHLDMDFWADADKSVYRPRWTLEELERRENFRYLPRRFVLSFRETGTGVAVVARHAETDAEEVHSARALVLAAGSLGSARIALRSLGRYGVPVPVLCNPYTYAPVLNTGLLSRAPRDRRHSLAQLTAIYAPPAADGAQPRLILAQYYSYRSLLTFKLMKETPLAGRESRKMMRLLIPVLGILGVHHEDRATPDKTCRLERGAPGEPDRLRIDYAPDAGELQRQAHDERGLFARFRALGCWPLKRIRPGHGSAIHYAGTLPMHAGERELTCDADCLLRGTRAVYLADGSVFPYLPAKGLTFTLMANADRVGAGLARRLAAARAPGGA